MFLSLFPPQNNQSFILQIKMTNNLNKKKQSEGILMIGFWSNLAQGWMLLSLSELLSIKT